MTTRERLLDAARACLLEEGHQASTVKAIARRAGVNHGLVHHYFGSKEGLWMEVVRREGERVRAAMPQGRKAVLRKFYGPEVVRRPDRLHLMMELLPLAKVSPKVAGALREHFTLSRALLQRNFDLPDELTATWVFAAFFGMAMQSGVDPALPVERAAASLLERFAQGEHRGQGARPRAGTSRGAQRASRTS